MMSQSPSFSLGPAESARQRRQPNSTTVEVEFGGQKVQVLKGGYYDRYRMNPDLDEIARDPAVGPNLDFFRKIPKQLVNSRVGRIYAPNFYYRTSSVQLVFLAPMQQLKSKLPAPLEPLAALPGYGLVALTFYSYLVCDNDPYNEVSVAIIVRQPGNNSYSITQLISSMWNRTFYGYVVALPVNTEIARVRGVYGYQFPKWLTDIDLSMEDGKLRGSISATNGAADLTLDAPLPYLKTLPSESAIGRNNAVKKIDGKWSKVEVQTNPLLATQCLLPRNVNLTRGDGPLSKILGELGISILFRMDVVKEAQMVLNMPKALDEFDGAKL